MSDKVMYSSFGFTDIVFDKQPSAKPRRINRKNSQRLFTSNQNMKGEEGGGGKSV